MKNWEENKKIKEGEGGELWDDNLHNLNPAESVDELRSSIDKYIRFYNYQRPHQSLDVLLPAMKYGIAV